MAALLPCGRILEVVRHDFPLETTVMAPGPELDRICPSVLVWSRYAPEVKVDLFSTAIAAAAGVFLVDPTAVASDSVLAALRATRIAGVVVTNENHARDSWRLAEELDAAIYTHADTQAALGCPASAELSDGCEFSPGLKAITIDGAAAGEIAVYSEADGGTLIIGDALINMESYGFTLLPGKYCANQKRMRKSLRKLLDYDFSRIVFAHGYPVASEAKNRLAQLLEGA